MGVADESLRERRFLWGPRQPSGGSGGFPLPVLLSDFEMSASAVLGVDTDLFGEFVFESAQRADSFRVTVSLAHDEARTWPPCRTPLRSSATNCS